MDDLNALLVKIARGIISQGRIIGALAICSEQIIFSSLFNPNADRILLSGSCLPLYKLIWALSWLYALEKFNTLERTLRKNPHKVLSPQVWPLCLRPRKASITYQSTAALLDCVGSISLLANISWTFPNNMEDSSGSGMLADLLKVQGCYGMLLSHLLLGPFGWKEISAYSIINLQIFCLIDLCFCQYSGGAQYGICNTSQWTVFIYF